MRLTRNIRPLAALALAVLSASAHAALQRNVAGQGFFIFDYDTTNNAPKTGDAGNITVYRSLDGGTATAITGTVTEISSTSMPGVYWVTLSQADTNGNMFAFVGISSTSGCKCDPFLGTTNATQTGDSYARVSTAIPNVAAGTNGGLPILANNTINANVTSIAGNAVSSSGNVTFPTSISSLTAAQAATAVWQDLTSSADFTTIGSIGKLAVTDLDTNVSSRMATFSLPANFSSLSLDTSGRILLQPTQTGVTIPTVTSVTNAITLPTAPTNWITAASISAGALNGKGDWLTTLGANAPANWINPASVGAGALNGKGDWSTINPDNTSIANILTNTTQLPNLITGTGINAQFTTKALSLAPTGSGGGSGFTGAEQCTLVFKDAAGTAVPNVVFTVAGTGTAATDGTGSLTIGLNPGIYTITAVPTSGTLWASTQITVTTAAIQSFPIAGTANTIPSPTLPTNCTVRFKAFNQDLTPAAGKVLFFALKTAPSGSGAAYVAAGVASLKATAAADGTVTVELPQGSTWSVSAGSGAAVTITVPSASTYSPPNMRI